MSRIFLIGFMGCGKTTWGKKLSAASGHAFIDLDNALEAEAGMSVAEYFATHSEEAFRELESKVLKETEYPENVIVSTGGGLPCFFDNMDWMNSHGQSLYIKHSPKTLADRLENARIKRPLVQGKSGDELVNFISQKLAEREMYYEQATHIVNGITISAEGLMEVTGIKAK